MTISIDQNFVSVRLNVFNRRVATREEAEAGLECGECLRCSVKRYQNGDFKGFRCMIRGDWTKRFLICDAFAGAPYGETKP
jgi:hypothetical protein